VVRIRETSRTLPFYRPVPLTDLPLIYHCEHQRYVRTELWKKATAALGEPDAEAPEFLNEDNLARFGAYWSDQ